MTWDYIVVGAGSAGCAVVNRLTESGAKRVLLLEAGGSDKSLCIKIPAGLAITERLEQYDWQYRSVPDPSRNRKTDQWLRGRVLGGSSSINGQMYVRGNAADYDRWAAMGNEGWSAKDVMPIFQALENSDKNSSNKKNSERGRKGPVYVRTVKNCHPLSEAFLQAAQNMGYTSNPDYNAPNQGQEGVSYAELTQRRGLRWSAADAFLKPIKHRKNLCVVVNACLHRLVFNERRVTGVVYEQGGVLHEAQAKNVVLCAGAINTPKLLMLSGIGDKAALSALGIPVKLDRPSVGHNLIEHPLLNLTYRTKIPSYNPTEGLLQKAILGLKYLLKRQGPIATVFEATAFLKTQWEATAPDIQLHFMPAGVARSGDDGPFVLPYPSVTVLLNKNHPLSRGHIQLVNDDPKEAPLIACELLQREEDLETLVRGVSLVRRIMSSAPMADFVEQEIWPGDQHTEDAALKDYIRRNTSLAYHPVGTCRMGVDEDAVVTPDLKLRGIDNLWIADASIMPDLISGNTNAACMMIGEKLGRQLAEKSVENQ